MKKLIILLSFILPLIISAQDTIVRSNGSIFSGFITENDSQMIAVSSADSAAHEVKLIFKKDLIFIRHRDGRSEELYQPDTLITTNGDLISCKVLEVGKEMITYFRHTNSVLDPVMIANTDLFMIHYHDGSRTKITALETVNQLSAEQSRAMARKDAVKYYKVSPGALAGCATSGALCFTLVGALPGAIVPFVKPNNLLNPQNPNNNLLTTDANYYHAYQKEASRMKRNKCLGAYVGGAAATGLFIAALISSNW